MKSYKLLFLLAVLIWACQAPQTEEQTETESEAITLVNDGGLVLPDKFIATVVVDSSYRGARHLVVNDNGDLYVKMRSNKTKAVLAMRDVDGDAKIDEQVEFGNFTGTGIGIHDDYLYASSHTEVFRYKLNENSLLPDTTAELVISGFPEQNEHADKPFTFDNDGNIYVNVGAPSNACMENHRTAGSAGMDPCPQRERQASIWRFDANTLGQSQEADGHQYCTGIRNCIALTWNDNTNSLFAAQHGRDQLSMFWPEMYDDKQNAELPAEEFIQVNDGDDFGWPFCYYDQFQSLKVLAPEYGGDGKEVGRCAEKKDPIMAFPGHMAPNDLLFYSGDQFPEKYHQGAFIAFHGSWNRAPEPQKGYFVVFIPFENGQPSGDWEVFADGFSELEEVKGPGDAKHRPMGLAEGPDGSLYITDSVKGKIWKISYSKTST